ncbi:3624_t:CDS:2 [Ambispora leptoticha]|uniref:3624_t:CDS:1 n=1 Tax=Ambispora leptoticha TaxID=144679 RepID=A0A9N9A370_9GLOM|nr:3624_t:CDS:2 [Ambispora leptoticha]
MAILTNGFALVCQNFTNSDSLPSQFCVCDFRINTRGCEEESFLRTANWILLGYTILITLTSGCFLYYQIRVRGQSLLLPATRERGFIRPRPQNAVHLINFAFNLLNTINLVLLLSDAFPNTLAAELSHDIPRVAVLGLSALLPVSIVYTIPNNENECAIPIPDKNYLDIWGLILMFGPFSCCVPLAILTGYYADLNDIEKANKYFKIHYLVHSFWFGIYTLTIIIFWYMLNSVLNAHIKELKEKDWKMKQAKRACRNVTNIVQGVFLYNNLTPTDGPPKLEINSRTNTTNTMNSHQRTLENIDNWEDMILEARHATLVNPVQLPNDQSMELVDEKATINLMNQPLSASLESINKLFDELITP